MLVGGLYRVGELLGRGASGEVFAATGPEGQEVALKLLRSDYAKDPELAARFRREARIAARISSPYVARVLGAGKGRDGQLWIAFERLQGESLEARLRLRHVLPLADVAWIVRHVLAGLAAAHVTGIVHRDVKPGNVFLESALPRARLLDFGVSKLRDPEVETASPNLTEEDEMLGTPSFMAPEQVDAPDVDARADIYSLGILAFLALTGVHPFPGTTTGAILQAKRHAQPRSLEEVSGRVFSPSLEGFMRTCLARDPRQRFQSAEVAEGAWQVAVRVS